MRGRTIRGVGAGCFDQPEQPRLTDRDPEQVRRRWFAGKIAHGLGGKDHPGRREIDDRLMREPEPTGIGLLSPPVPLVASLRAGKRLVVCLCLGEADGVFTTNHAEKAVVG